MEILCARNLYLDWPNSQVLHDISPPVHNETQNISDDIVQIG